MATRRLFLVTQAVARRKRPQADRVFQSSARTRTGARHGVRCMCDDDEITPKEERALCGARTRLGGRCRARAVWDRDRDKPVNGRCRMHGGLSTGPKTEWGRRASVSALLRGHAAWRKRSSSGNA